MSLSVEEGKRLVSEFCAEYPSAYQIQYKIRETQEEIFYEQATIEAIGRVYGAYFPSRNLAVFATANFRDENEFKGTLKHEIFGHFGLNTCTTEEKCEILISIIDAKDQPGISQLWEKISQAYDKESDLLKAEEVFAFTCEEIDTHSVHQAELGQAALQVCMDKSRTLELSDLSHIGSMIAQGMREGSRKQQVFPFTDQEQFKQGLIMEKKKPFHIIVAEKLIKQLQTGTAPWQKPWKPGYSMPMLPINPTTGNRYKGINTIQLISENRTDNRWLTYKQATTLGAQVRKGEKSTPVQYWKFTEEQIKRDEQGKPRMDSSGRTVKETLKLERPRMFMASVFNGEQIDGLPPLEQSKVQDKVWHNQERAEAILKTSGANISHNEKDQAFYRPSTDSIHLPSQNQFPNREQYYATALHELGHWTGHKSRLNRDLSHPFGSEGYAKEELRAEISSMIMGETLNMGHDPEQHVAYAKTWIKILKDDPLEVFRAAADAEKIQKYVLDLELKQVQDKEIAPVNTNQKTESKNISSDDEKQNKIIEEALGRLNESKSTEKHYLNVPYTEKDQAKSLGAKWDRKEQSWYVPSRIDLSDFAQWNNHGNKQPAQVKIKRTYLAVPYGERELAKTAGAQWDKKAKSWYIGSNADIQQLNRWLPHHFSSQQDPAMGPVEEFKQTLGSVGCIVTDDHPIMDGNKHRISTEGDKQGHHSGFYVGHLDGHPAGYIKNNRTGLEVKWKSKGFFLDPEEKAKLTTEAVIKRVERGVDLEITQRETANGLRRRLRTLIQIKEPTPYLKEKGVKSFKDIFTDDLRKKTFIPAYDKDGILCSMQTVYENGSKRFTKNSKKQGCFHVVGGFDSLKDSPVLVVSEGYATAATVSEVLDFATVSAFDSGNLPSVVKLLHEQYPEKPIIVAGDDDRSLELTQGINPGRVKAELAAKSVGGKAVFPVFTVKDQGNLEKIAPITPNQYRANALTDKQLAYLDKIKALTDFNDIVLKSELGKEGVKRQLRSAVSLALKTAKTLNEAEKLEYQKQPKKAVTQSMNWKRK